MKTSAGFVILSKEKDAILGCIPWGKQNRTSRFLDLPKGQIDKGEDPLEAASRELHEETGLKVKNFKDVYPFTNGPVSYNDEKDIVLYMLLEEDYIGGSIDLSSLKCTSKFKNQWGKMVPEMIGFVWVPLKDFNKFYKSIEKVVKENI
jgi:8-oxo-dGTP pyrophosphatase MutT (NUDIX family)